MADLVHPITRSGGWTSRAGYHRRARMALTLLDEKAADWRTRYDHLFRAKQGRVPIEAVDALNEIILLADATVLFAAMAVESFLNHYGVVRLGEAFYTQHYERLSIVSKLAAILATCCGALITPRDEITRVVRRMFQQRNSLAHPKTQEAKRVRRQARAKIEPPRDVARRSIQDMDRFIELFRHFDSDAGRWEHV